MGISRDEAAKRLRAGDISFVLEADPKKLPELASYDPAAPFFVALRAEALNVDPGFRATLYALSWSKAKGLIRREAGRRLIETESARAAAGNADLSKLVAAAGRFRTDYPDDAQSRGLLAESLRLAGEYEAVRALFPAGAPARTEKERAVELLAAASRGEDGARALVERFFLDEPVGPEYERTYSELMRLKPVALSAQPLMLEVERAVRGRLAVSYRSYGEAVGLFKRAAENDPSLFLSHTELLGDAGRAFQYGGSPSEGAAWFESLAREGLDDGIRFRLLFYAGRMLRQIDEREKANLLFAEALPFAPDAVQRDACLWYVLDGAIALSPVSALPLFRKYVPLWKTPSSFADLLDRYCGMLVAGKNWSELMETFRIIRPVADSATVARYAYVIGRAVSLGYIGADRPRELLSRIEERKKPDGVERAETARAFFRIAFESDAASFYYRCLAAALLGENLDPVPAEELLNRFGEENAAVGPAAVPSNGKPDENPAGHSEPLEFLFSFLDYGSADRVLSYSRPLIDSLSVDEIRSLSRRFAKAGYYGESVRAASILARRPGYRLTRSDMKLLYPQAFSDEISEAAARWKVSEELLFGLVRTESLFIPDIVSHAGAEGLAQLMRPTARDVASRLKGKIDLAYEDGELDLGDPYTNVNLGAWYLANLNERLGSPLLALFSYNGGITRVRKWRTAENALPEDLFLETVPITETRDYGRKVLAAAAVYGYLYRGKALSDIVSDFFPGPSHFGIETGR